MLIIGTKMLSSRALLDAATVYQYLFSTFTNMPGEALLQR